MLRLLAAAALLMPAAVSAQTLPSVPQSSPEGLGTTAAAPTTYATQPLDARPTIDVDRIVVAGFPTYDKDGVPGLSPAEFGQWMAQLFANAGQEIPVGDYLSLAFAQTDVTKDGTVEPGELTAFLRGG